MKLQNYTQQNHLIHKLLLNFVHLVSLQGLTFILPLITAPYLFRVLGAEKFGLVSFSLVIMAFLRIIVDYGFQLTATREVALNREDIDRLSTIFSQVMITKSLLLILALFILTVLILIFDNFNHHWVLFYASFLFVVGHALFPIWFFQGVEEMKYISYLNIASKLLFLITIFLFIKSPSDYLLYPLFNGLWIIIVAIYGLFIIYSKYNITFSWQPISEIKKVIKNGWSIFLGEVAPSLYTNSTVFLLGLFVSMESVGYFTLANRLVSATTSIIYIIRNVTFPSLTRNFKNFKKITFIMVVMGLSFTLFLLLSANLIVPLLFGLKSNEITELVYLLAISPMLYAIILSFGSNYLLVLKQDKQYKNITMLTSLFGVILSFVLVPYFHIYGAVLTIVITQFLVGISLIRVAMYHHHMDKGYHAKKFK